MVYPVGGGKGNKFAPGTATVRVPNPLKVIVMLLVEKHRELYGFEPDPKGIGLMTRVVEAILSQKSVDLGHRNMEKLSDAAQLYASIGKLPLHNYEISETIAKILLKYQDMSEPPAEDSTEDLAEDLEHDGQRITQGKFASQVGFSQQYASRIQSVLPLVLDACKNVVVVPQAVENIRKELAACRNSLLVSQTELAKKEQKIQQLEKRIAANNIPVSEEENIAVLEQKLEETVDSLKKILKGDDPFGRNFKTSKVRPITARIQDLVNQTEQWLKTRTKR